MNILSCASCGRCEEELLRLALLTNLPEVTLVTGRVLEGTKLPETAVLCGRCAVESGCASYAVRGCPVSYAELVYTLRCIKDGLTPRRKPYPVCIDCKAAENDCLLIRGLPCRGPVTEAGCGAKCPSMGQPCTGCRGDFEGANLPLWIKLTDIEKE